MSDKKDKTPEQLVAAIVERGVDDVAQQQRLLERRRERAIDFQQALKARLLERVVGRCHHEQVIEAGGFLLSSLDHPTE